MRISYKLPLIGIIAILGATLVVLLGVHGYIDESFNQSPGSQTYTLIILAVEVVYFTFTPRNREILVNIDGISIPNILLPPYIIKHLNWKDIKRIETKSIEGEYSGSWESATLYTNYDSAKIYGGLCLPNFYFIMNHEVYNSLMVIINDFVYINKNLRWLYRQIKNKHPVDQSVKQRLKESMEDMIDAGLASKDEFAALIESINYEVFGMSIAERRKLYKEKQGKV